MSGAPPRRWKRWRDPIGWILAVVLFIAFDGHTRLVQSSGTLLDSSFLDGTLFAAAFFGFVAARFIHAVRVKIGSGKGGDDLPGQGAW